MVMSGEGRDGTRIYGLFCWSLRGLRARMKSAHGEPIVVQRLLGARGVIGFAPCRSDRAHLSHLSRSSAGRADGFLSHFLVSGRSGCWRVLSGEPGLERLAPRCDGPDDPGELVCDGDCGAVSPAPVLDLERPLLQVMRPFPAMGREQHRAGPADQKRPEVRVSGLADRPEPPSLSARAFLRRQPERARKLPSRLEAQEVSDHRRKRRGVQETYTRNRLEPLDERSRPGQGLQLLFDLPAAEPAAGERPAVASLGGRKRCHVGFRASLSDHRDRDHRTRRGHSRGRPATSGSWFGRWLKRKGIAFVRAAHGLTYRAEIHWYEARGIGRKELKVKRYLP